MYDYQVLIKAWETSHQEFETDIYPDPTSVVPGKVPDLPDLKLYQWPGHGVPKEREYQFVEDEYMRGEEYQDPLCTGTPDQVKTYCRELIETVGKDGREILYYRIPWIESQLPTTVS